MLGDVERELVEVREEVAAVNLERRAGQEGGGSELEGLEEGWRRGVRGVLEVGVAVEGVGEGVRGVLRGGE